MANTTTEVQPLVIAVTGHSVTTQANAHTITPMRLALHFMLLGSALHSVALVGEAIALTLSFGEPTYVPRRWRIHTAVSPMSLSVLPPQ